MRATLRSIQKEECRVRDLDDSERAAFSTLSHLQRHFPALTLFPTPSVIGPHPHLEFPSPIYVKRWIEPDTTRSNQWNVELSKESTDPSRVYVKTVHLLNPIDLLKQVYVMPSHPWMPQVGHKWKDTVSKLHSRHNQAYVDAVANYVISRFRESNVTPHGVMYYGSYTGISSNYIFNITSDYDTYRQKHWFWKGIKEKGGRMTLSHDESLVYHPQYDAFREEMLTSPLMVYDGSEEDEVLPFCEDAMEAMDAVDAVAMEFDQLSFASEKVKDDEENDEDDDKDDEENDEDDDKDDEDDEDDESGEEQSDGSSEDMASQVDVQLILPNVPVLAIVQEAQEGVLDNLLDEEVIDGCRHGTQAWETRWFAWIFQVIAVLSFLQRSIQFTHNDLHSNNIVWRSTTQRFVYYRDRRTGTVWRVPTFGKIFSLIDFGRAIFRVGRTQWISDDHLPDQDAGGQYNFGSFYDSSKPKVVPNPSFDLCRLAVSMIDGLFGGERPTKKRGKDVPVMSEEGSWIVQETRSPLYNLLWSWMVDDAGRTIYETEDGEEKYNGFELYIRIAQDVHSAIPHEQAHRSCFKPFVWKERIAPEESVYEI